MIIVAANFIVRLLSDREDLFFFGLHLIIETKSALRSVKTFFLFLYEIELQLHFDPPTPIKSPKSDCDDF